MNDATLPSTLADVPRTQARHIPMAVALSCQDRTTTYAELDQCASKVANGLCAAGCSPGDRIAYLGKNSDRYFEVLFGAAKACVALVPINWRLAEPEIEHVLADSCAKIAFVDSENATVVDGLKDRLPALEQIVEVDGDGAYTSWRDAQKREDPALPVAEVDVVLQMYSSGTTGRPKGVEIVHGAFAPLRAAERELGDWATLSPGDVSLVAMPTFHMLGTGLAITALTAGARCVVLRQTDAREALRLLAEERVTHLTSAPAFLGLLLADPHCAEADLSSLRNITYAGSPISPALLERAQAAFGCYFLQYYGATETTGQVTCLAPSDHLDASPERLRSCGRPIPGVEIRISDSEGSELPVGEVGEIQVRSASLMKGYWNLSGATAEAIVDGWYHTGDAGFRDRDGYITIVDRIKDMIVTGGENVYSAEVEAALSKDPDVAEAAVIGVPHPKWGEAVKAIVVPKTGSRGDANAILKRLRVRLAAYKIPKSIDFSTALPRNASGKVLKRVLREPFWSGRDREIA